MQRRTQVDALQSQVWRMEDHASLELCFEKRLSETDVKGSLEIPQAANCLPPRDEVMHVRIQNGSVMQFRARSRRTGGRRYMTDQWRGFVGAACPRRGDILRYYHLVNTNVYLVELERPPPHLRLFGKDIYLEFIT
ncbi:hypothetical protein F0562_025983 [Nyssa sinensis]|uniref:TF-B3 domain-containing protein n=1 Tax=Nyssa sinensis TaxID=561372 RepID=A0A5J5BDJ6_9ASTE|nr:hypothetical protein F0562_025983 [Nyssa sinensis]